MEEFVAGTDDVAVVCSPYSTPSSDCDFYGLGYALAATEYSSYVLRPGFYFVTVPIDRPVTIDADDGVVLSPFGFGLDPPVLDITRDADGSVFRNFFLDYDQGSVAGPIANISGATVTFEDLQVRNMQDVPVPLLTITGNADVTLVRPDFASNSYSIPAGIEVVNSSITIDGGSFSDNGLPLWVVLNALSSSVLIQNTTFSATIGSSSFLTGNYSDIALIDATFAAGPVLGTPIYAVYGALTLTGGTVTSIQNGATAVLAYGATVQVDGTRFLTGGGAGALQVAACPAVDVSGATFESTGYNLLNAVALLDVLFSDGVSVDDTWFCGAREGALALNNSCQTGSPCQIQYSVFQANTDFDVGGGVFVGDSVANIDHATFYANATISGAGAAVEVTNGSTSEIRDSLFVANPGPAPTVASPRQPEVFDGNVFDTSTVSPASFAYEAADNPTLDVVFVKDPAPLFPRCGVPLWVDGELSDPYLFEHQVGALPVCGPSEVPFDGIDQDCDGNELCAVDLDGDGVGSDELVEIEITAACPAPGDCDDGDPAVTDCGSASDTDGDGIVDEFDCNDVDPSIGLCRFVGSGCTTAGASTGLFGWLGLLLVRARRSAGSSGAGGVESLR